MKATTRQTEQRNNDYQVKGDEELVMIIRLKDEFENLEKELFQEVEKIHRQLKFVRL